MSNKPFRIFTGEATNKATRVWGGESSGICDWDNIRYPIMFQINREMFSHMWNEDEIQMNSDIKSYRQDLTPRERTVFNILTGALTFFDSIANKFNFVAGYLSTDPSIIANIQLIGAAEGLHVRSYQYLSSSVQNDSEKTESFEAPKTIKTLRERNDLLVKPIQDFVDLSKKILLDDNYTWTDEDLTTLVKGIFANNVLEGVAFSAGFAYFHSLARSQRMTSSNNMINLIKEDETQHAKFWGEVIKITFRENPQINTPELYQWVKEYIHAFVEKEREWATELFEGITTITVREYMNYVEYLTNVVCRNCGLEELYPENLTLKSTWILKYGQKISATRTDFFETNVIAYRNETGGSFDL